MITKTLIVIPTFNNPNSVAQVLADCLNTLPQDLLVIDDGSEISVESIVGPIDPQRVTFVRHEINRGKGAAIKSGFQYALAHDYTHVLTIDGDGQHLACEAKKLTQHIDDHPWSMIIGQRVLTGDHVPGASKFGRKFSNFWVKYQTGTTIRDSQSGLRAYPLFHIQNLNLLTSKYDFEIEILVRLLWRDVKVLEVPVEVVYQPGEERVSHFHKLLDNTRISLLNIVLVAISLFSRHLGLNKFALAVGASLIVAEQFSHWPTALLVMTLTTIGFQLNGLVVLATLYAWYAGPIPPEYQPHAFTVTALVYFVALGIAWDYRRRFNKVSGAAWSGQMRGGRFGNAFLRITSKYVGLRATYFCLYFIVPYFFLFAPKARRASRQYWHTVQPDKSLFVHFWSTTRHFFMFGKILLDRLFETQKQNDFFKVDVRGMQPIRKLLEENQGVIMLTAHIGGWALSVESLAKLAKSDKVVVSELAQGNDHRHLVNTYKQIIDPSQAGLPIFEYKRLLSSGQIVAMMGDRPMTDKLELVKFFGKLAAFDCTPYRIAAACGAPIVTTFAFKESIDEYVLYVSEPKYLVYDQDIPREETVRGWVQSFATELETYLTKYPEQWSNFYPFFSSLPKAPLPAVANHKS